MNEDQICLSFVGQLNALQSMNKLNGIFFHVPNEIASNAHPAFGMKLRKMGKLLGVADYIFLWENGCGALEFKSAKGTLSHHQVRFKEQCSEYKINYGICRSSTDGFDFLEQWGFIKKRA